VSLVSKKGTAWPPRSRNPQAVRYIGRMTLKSQSRFRRLFEHAFRVSDIAESLVSFDAELPSADALRVMERRMFTLAGVRRDGHTAGFIRIDDLNEPDAPVGRHQRPFEPTEVIGDEAPLNELVTRLAATPRLFVTAFGNVNGIVTLTDLQRPPVRMWLFGLITIIEMSFTDMILEQWPNEEWTDLLSEGRMEKTRALHGERCRRSEDKSIRLLDCLQFSDKGQILVKDPQTRAKLRFDSKGAGDRAVQRVEALRNSLAHAQDILTGGWETIVALTRNLGDILDIDPDIPTLVSRPANPPVWRYRPTIASGTLSFTKQSSPGR
jgi:hypothetical protein